ncbi:hypothetical protein KQX54_019181 [Cotesia glomerata]|uniref:Alpha-carbonic anhydrase domain-containing protein n=1 Tax=Cotesia glomerata TaxID=32391 RepID=A0AAV7IB28_COTGL|nr:hypothetical protein KQX54_019181 [Cotesia glomerata]
MDLGPAFWGLINPQWSLCSKGRRQSPINIEPDKLLFDPHLRPVQVDKHKVAGHLHNTGQFLVFKADKDAKTRVNITGGPLAYHYQFEEIYIHYGMTNDQGSEHQVNNYAFPAEIQVFGFNAELYHNMSEAQHKSQGLVAISLMVQFSRGRCLEIDIDCDKDIKRAGERAWFRMRIGRIWVLGGEKPTNTRELFGNLRIYSQQNHAVLFLLYPYPLALHHGNGYGDATQL